MMSTVAADLYADWSLLPLRAEDEEKGTMTVEVEREEEKDGSYGSVLRILLVGRDGKSVPIREVTWAFHDLDESEEMWVGMLVAKPTESESKELEVKLEGFEIKLRDWFVVENWNLDGHILAWKLWNEARMEKQDVSNDSMNSLVVSLRFEALLANLLQRMKVKRWYRWLQVFKLANEQEALQK